METGIKLRGQVRLRKVSAKFKFYFNHDWKILGRKMKCYELSLKKLTIAILWRTDYGTRIEAEEKKRKKKNTGRENS